MLIANTKGFEREMSNIVKYSQGFLEGAKLGKPKMLANVGKELRLAVAQYIDSSARVNPQSLHHVYEWYKTGSPDARLFDINYRVVANSLSMNATIRQSNSIRDGSTVPFRNKAYVMENGISVRVEPKISPVLVFEENGETVYTRKGVNIENPGGEETVNGLETTFREFFLSYLSQSVMFSSGMMDNLRNPIDFKKNLRAGAKGGRSVGVSVGKNWISKDGI